MMIKCIYKMICIYRVWLFACLIGAGLTFGTNKCASGDDAISNIALYYLLGGFKAAEPPASIFSGLGPIRSGLNVPGAFCGSFNPAIDVENILSNQLSETLASLSSFPQTIVGALPGSILCRAQPGMCQLLQHYVVRAENKWNIAVKSCEETVQNASEYSGPYHDWIQVSKSQKWQQQAAMGSNATTAKKQVDQTDGCVVWVGGESSGCKGKQPIWPTSDTVMAGWCLLQEQNGKCSSAPPSYSSASESRLRSVWPTPMLASKWVTDVLGDHKVQVGESTSSIIGTGLLPKIDEETNRIQEELVEIVYSASPPLDSTLDNLSTTQVFISSTVIEALRDLPDRDLLIARISNEVALSRVINKAFLARRLLLSGMMEPNIQAAGTVTESIHKKIDLLEHEINRATFETQIHRRLIADTALNILDAHRVLTTPESPVQRTPDLRLP